MTASDPGREVALTAGDQVFTLYAGNRALRMIERETDQSLMTLFSDEGLAKVGIGTLTTLVWALLQRNHPDLTLEDTDDVIDGAGFEAVLDAVSRAMALAMPGSAKRDANGHASGKAPGANGTGRTSSGARVRPGSALPSSGT